MYGRTLRTLLACCCLATLASHAAAPTKFSTGAAEVRDFVAASTTIGYAGTFGGGIWKTTDAGANWTKLNAAVRTVWKIALNPGSPTTCVYAGTDSGLWRSIDGGTNWTQLTTDDTRAIAIQPTPAAACGAETMLIGVFGAGVFKSTNGGTTITRSSGTAPANSLDSAGVIGLAYYPGQSAVAYAVLECNRDDLFSNPDGNWGGVFRTADGGTTWAAMNAGLLTPDSARPCVTSIAANGTSVVVGTLDLSTQGATFRIGAVGTTTWTQSNGGGGQPFGVYWVGPDLSSANGFFAGSHQFGPWRSTDGGANFNQIYVQGTDPDMQARTYASGAFTTNTVVAGVFGLGLFRTTMGNSPWNLPTTPIAADRVNDLSSHTTGAPNTYWVALKNGGVMKSTNAGTNWAQVNTGLNTYNDPFGAPVSNLVITHTADRIAAHPSNTTIVAVANDSGLYSLSGGATWNKVSTLMNSGSLHLPQGLTITPGGLVYYSLFDGPHPAAGPVTPTPGGLYSAAGSNFAALAPEGVPILEGNPGLGVVGGGYRVRTMQDVEHHAFLLMYDSLPYITGNGGATWSRVNVNAVANDTGFQRLAFFDIAQKPSTPSITVASSYRGIYRSNSFGDTWDRVNASGLTQVALSALIYSSNDVLWGGDRGGQLWCSTDDGTTWQAVTGGNLTSPITELKFLNNQVHVLTDGNGLWKKDTVCP